MVFVRRYDASGKVRVLGRSFEVSEAWSSRLVRCDVDFSEKRLRLHRLRRREPSDQPVLAKHPHDLPRRPFSE